MDSLLAKLFIIKGLGKVLLAFIVVSTLLGCATPVPMEQLKDEALISGDWSIVEKREEVYARRHAYSDMVAYCQELDRGPYILYCESRGIRIEARDCQCVHPSSLSTLFGTYPRF